MQGTREKESLNCDGKDFLTDKIKEQWQDILAQNQE
jgi:hypothetical protein